MIFLMMLLAMFSPSYGENIPLKKIQSVYSSSNPHMVGDGFRVFNYFPSGNNLVYEVSPFVLLDYNAPFYFSPTQKKRGVGAHPHRGFETVTLVYEGTVAHRDSTGAKGVIGPNEVQWMTAGSGVLHEEFHEEQFSKKGGSLHAVQLWVNLPAKDKMTAPKYQTLVNTPSFDLGQGSEVRVIAGEFKGLKGAASTFTPMEVYDVRLKKEAMATFDLPESYNTMLLITKGNVLVNGIKQLNFKDFLLFSHEGERITVKAAEDSMFLVLSGLPIHEKVVMSGPFVMNTQEEINKAYKDLENGKFGKIAG